MRAAPMASPVAIEFEFPQDPEFLMGGGGLYSTAADYMAFCRMLLGGGTLGRAAGAEAGDGKADGENHIGALEVPKVRSDNPQLVLETEMFPGIVKKWGLSFLINMDPWPGGRAAGSLNWAGVHNTFFWSDSNTQRLKAST